MPSASGVYSLPLGYLAVTGSTIEASQHNPPLEDIAAALTGRLSRDGTAPMLGGLKGIVGTASIPSYAFSTDATTGLFKTTNGVGVTVGGTQVAEFTSDGLASGAWLPGMILAWPGVSPPNSKWVFPAGQTLSRATFPTLWTFAQTQIASGANTFFNNGDGATTFGIGDLRGRTIAATDNAGGGDPGRLASTAFSATRFTVGGVGGESSHTLTASEIPSITSNVGVSGTLNGSTSNVVTATTTDFLAAGGNPIVKPTTFSAASVTVSGSMSGSATSNNTGGASHNNMQPTCLCPYIMFAGA